MMCDGVPINEIAMVLGHASVQATTRYVWSDFSHLKVAALEVIPYDK
jgi:integrase